MEVWQWIARGNIQQTSCNSPLWVHAGLSGGCYTLDGGGVGMALDC